MIQQESSSNQTLVPPYRVSSLIVCLWWFIHRVERIGWHPVSILKVKLTYFPPFQELEHYTSYQSQIQYGLSRLASVFSTLVHQLTLLKHRNTKGWLVRKKKTWPTWLSQRLKGLLPGKGKNWPIADWRVPSNNPRNNCGTHFGSRSLVVSKVVNGQTGRFTDWVNGMKNSGLVNFIPE